ncbi:hypothetical protein NF552_22570 (plasmid) [Roseomonas mucosa]|nr:hypothetical protein NF552_22570 [Roseomonas mucosa]
MQLKRLAVDTSKATFTLHGVDGRDQPVLRQNMTRTQFETFCAKLPVTEVVMEACGSSHHWGRFLQGFGHTVRLIPPQYVKPFVKLWRGDHNLTKGFTYDAGMSRTSCPSLLISRPQ